MCSLIVNNGLPMSGHHAPSPLLARDAPFALEKLALYHLQFVGEIQLIETIRHLAGPLPSGGSASGLSATGAWAWPLPVINTKMWAFPR
jgi:hypothetical protein